MCNEYAHGILNFVFSGYIGALGQDTSNSTTNTQELLQSSTKPLL